MNKTPQPQNPLTWRERMLRWHTSNSKLFERELRADKAMKGAARRAGLDPYLRALRPGPNPVFGPVVDVEKTARTYEDSLDGWRKACAARAKLPLAERGPKIPKPKLVTITKNVTRGGDLPAAPVKVSCAFQRALLAQRQLTVTIKP